MPIVIIIIAVGIGLLIATIWLVKQALFTREIIRNFKKCNVVVAGKKGTGKGLIFNKVIRKRNDKYYGNVNYGGDFEEISLKDVSVMPNTYKDFIEEKVTKIDRRFIEKKDIYIDDGGVYLPSYMDSTLYKVYPSMPIYYALSRHLYNHNVHVNVQCYERLWKALREQADYFITCKKTIKIFGIFFTKCITYDKYQSAVNGVLPLKARLMNKYSKAEVDIYNATNGDIRSGWVIQFKHNIRYNTRAFENVILKGDRITE